MTDTGDTSNSAGTDPAPGCTSFEATLAFVDGLLADDEARRAEAHAHDCALCGPMVSGWAEVSGALVRSMDDAAEIAKPDLAGLADRVLARVAAPKPAPAFGDRLLAFLSALQAPVALVAAAGAIAFVVLPMLADPAGPGLEVATVLADPNDCHLHKLAFDDADGMVMKAGDNMTVIWISEHEGV